MDPSARYRQLMSKHWVKAVALVLILVVVVSCIHRRFLQPKVRSGNRQHENPYGAEGEQRLPQAVIIGIRKAGTRALLAYLAHHPDVRAAKAEAHFFAYGPNYRQGLDFYRHLMPYSKPGQVTIEKTPNYFHSSDCAPRIHDMNSSAKIILVLREPATRAVSDYMQFEKAKGETRSFEEVAFSRDGAVRSSYGPVWRSTYYKLLKKYWLPYFPKQQIHIVDGDALGHQNPGSEMKLVQEFLGLRPVLTEDSFVFSEEKGFYCYRDESGEHCLGSSKGRPHPKPDLAAMAELKQYFEPYNRRLFEFIGRDFGWNS